MSGLSEEPEILEFYGLASFSTHLSSGTHENGSADDSIQELSQDDDDDDDDDDSMKLVSSVTDSVKLQQDVENSPTSEAGEPVLRRNVEGCHDCLNDTFAKVKRKPLRLEAEHLACSCEKRPSLANLRTRKEIHAGVEDQRAGCDETCSQTCKVEDQSKQKSERFPCFCGKRFGSLANLRRHEEIHAGIKYQCCYCDKMYSQPYKVKDHVTREHGDVTQPPMPVTTTSRNSRKGCKTLITNGVCAVEPATLSACESQVTAVSTGEDLALRIVKCESLRSESDVELAVANNLAAIDQESQRVPVDTLEVPGEGVLTECEKELKAIEVSKCNVGRKQFSKVGCIGKCNMCEILFSSVGSLRKHMYAFHESAIRDAKPFEVSRSSPLQADSNVGNGIIRSIHNDSNVTEVSHVTVDIDSGEEKCSKSIACVAEASCESAVNTSGSEPYICEICDSSVGTQGHHLRFHMLGHLGLTSYVCNSCSGHFETSKASRNHCCKGSESKARVELTSRSMPIPSRCVQRCGRDCCWVPFTPTKQLKYSDQFHGPEDLVCSQCNKTFGNSHNFGLHMEWHKRFPGVVRRELNKVFKKRVLPRTPNAISRSGDGCGRFACNDCGKRLTSCLSLERHVKRFHRSSNALRCGRCSKRFKTEQALKLHELNHENLDRKPSCGQCGRFFGNYIVLQRHMSSVHSQTPIFTCTYCHRNFEDCRLLFDHLSVHEFELYFVCQRCFFISNVASEALEHLSLHCPNWKTWKSYKPYFCVCCNKRYRAPTLVTSHTKWLHPETRDHASVVYF